MSSPSPLISYRNVYKSFGQQSVYRQLNLDVYERETLCIIGPSGFGKTVALKMLIGLIQPDSGQILFDNIDLTDFAHDSQFLPIRRRIAMVFQCAALFDSLCVFDNIAYPLREQFSLNFEEIRSRVLEKLQWVGLAQAVNKMPSQLSDGMKKRVGLARAIVTQPEVVLFDEPTAGLDPANTKRISNLIISLRKTPGHRASIVVTHDMPTAEKIADRVALMGNGKVRNTGTLQQLRHSSDKETQAFFMLEHNSMERS
ncbi:MAG: ATP-binding cassette domain-containing protein [Myxococcota bacterium]